MKPASEGTLNILLIKAREEQNLTQQAVANHIGCDLNNVSRWERGIVFPSPYFRRKLCELYGKNEEELGFFKQNRVKKPPREKPSRTPIISTVPSADREMLLTPILGREREIVTILNFLQEDKKRLVTITGTGGVGKTRLAREVEARLIKDSQYKTIYVSLASLANNTQVLPLIGKHLGLENSITSERVIAALKGIPARHLLVLHSSKAIGKEATTIARRLGRPAPHPGFGPQVELSSRDTGGLLDLLGIGKTLSWKPHHAGRGATSPPGD